METAKVLHVLSPGASSLTMSTAPADNRQQSDSSHEAAQQQGPDTSLLNPHLQQQWDHARNAHLGPIAVKPGSHKKYWWSCDQCPDGHPHRWEAAPSARTRDRTLSTRRGTGCPFCTSQAVCPHNSLATTAPDVAAEWSDKNEATPHDYTVGSDVSVIWRCRHGHEWNTSIKARTIRGAGCPECFIERMRWGRQKRHPTLSQSKHAMMAMWDLEANTRAGLDPSRLRCNSNKHAHWICSKCPRGQPHKWLARIDKVYRGTGCPRCSRHQACVCNSLQSLHPELALEWDHDKNKSSPADFTAQSSKKVWWKNQRRGEFWMNIGVRTASAYRSRWKFCFALVAPI